MLLDKDKKLDNVQKHNICTNIPSTTKTNKLRGFSPQANYTDRATAALKLIPTLADRGCRAVSATNPQGRYFRFCIVGNTISYQFLFHL
jgi:hypothetical protein